MSLVLVALATARGPVPRFTCCIVCIVGPWSYNLSAVNGSILGMVL
jgi:hypothetical protein